MRDITLGLDLDGHGLTEAFSGLLARLEDLTPAMDEAGRLMLSSASMNFAAQGRPWKWQPLSPATARRKGHGIILYETGRLMDSISFDSGPDFLSVFAPAPYARAQQDGGRQTPARPFLVFQQEDVQSIKGLVEGYISGSLRGGA
jgi:phage virion morphogenesis protein